SSSTRATSTSTSRTWPASCAATSTRGRWRRSPSGSSARPGSTARSRRSSPRPSWSTPAAAPARRRRSRPAERAGDLRPMRIGVFHGRKYYLRNVSTALTALVEGGHELVLAAPESKGRPVRVPAALEGSGRVATALYPTGREDGLDRSVAVLRATRNALRYESPALRDAYANRRRAYRKLLGALAAAPGGDPPPPVETGAGVDAALAGLEALVPPVGPLVAFIREQRLDAVVCIGRVNFGGDESEVAKAARVAGVPSGLVVYSWDNLSSKGLVHVHPDRLFVWNDFQVDEAVELHGADRRSVIATGAPRFDEFFALRPSAPREQLLGRVGLDPAAPTVLYLGSSGFVTKREPELIERWVATLRSSGDERLRTANVLIRPHPGTLDEPAWTAWQPGLPGVAMPRPR